MTAHQIEMPDDDTLCEQCNDKPATVEGPTRSGPVQVCDECAYMRRWET